MSKESFANLIVTKLNGALGWNGSAYSSDTPKQAQTAIAEAITEYLIANTTITISYNGVLNTGSGADVIASDTMKITGSCSLVSTPSSFEGWVATLQSAIASAFTVLSPSTQGVIVTFQPFNGIAGALQIPQTNLKVAHEGNPKSPALAVWTVICGGILDWLNSSLGKSPTATAIAATRTGISSGTAALLSITVT